MLEDAVNVVLIEEWVLDVVAVTEEVVKKVVDKVLVVDIVNVVEEGVVELKLLVVDDDVVSLLVEVRMVVTVFEPDVVKDDELKV